MAQICRLLQQYHMLWLGVLHALPCMPRSACPLVLCLPSAVLLLRPAGGQSAWHVAAREGHTDVLQALADGLRAAASVTPLREQKGFTDLGMTDDDIIEALVQAQDSKGLSALHLACIKGHAEATEVLMHLGANPFAMVRVK